MDLKKSAINLTLKQLDPQYFFTDFLLQASQQQLLSPETLQRIQKQLLGLLHQHANSQAFGDSSLPLDQIEDQMESIEFTLGMSLKQQRDVSDMLVALKTTSLAHLFINGQIAIKNKIIETKRIHVLLKKTLLPLNNIAYHESLVTAVNAFLKVYNYDSAAHQSIITFDYPVFLFDRRQTGITAIEQYITYGFYENLFLSLYAATKLEALFSKLFPDFAEQFVSLFEYGATHYLLAALLFKVDINTPFTTFEFNQLYQILERINQEDNNIAIIKEKIKQFPSFITLNKKVQAYFLTATATLYKTIQFHCQEKTLESICFI